MTGQRSPALDNALLIIEILRRIPHKRFITSMELHKSLMAAECAVSLRTVQRHLDAITQRFDIECDARSKPYGYRWLTTSHGFNLPLLSPSEALLLRMAQLQLNEILPAKTLDSLAPLFASAQRQLDVNPAAQPACKWVNKVRSIPENQPLLPAAIGNGIFEAVTDALYHEYKLDIHYRNAQGKRKNTTVWPLGLAQQGARLYLVCRFEGYDNERILAMTRLTQASVRMEHFDYPRNFNLARYEGEGHFAFTTGQRVRLRFCIDKQIGQHLVESKLSNDQTVIERDESLEITATVIESELLHRWLRGWGNKVWEVHITEVEFEEVK